MAVAIEWSLESLRHVTATSIARSRHCFGSHAAASTRPAYEKDLILFVHAGRLQSSGKPLWELRVYSAVRKGLPLDGYNRLADLTEIWQSDKGPLGPCSDIDKHCARVCRKAGPRLVNRHVDDVNRLQLLQELTPTLRPRLLSQTPPFIRQDVEHTSSCRRAA